ncbi:ATP-binding cassette domain-containing protein [Enterococcus faecium]|nr:ATP-binding cassette domain-containing protein [Enterococcus faecium]
MDEVSFAVMKGTILGLLGPNGAGKSTIINIITGLLNKTSGQISLFGKELSEKIENFGKELV